MKSMQVLFVCAFVVLCTANPIPDEETVTSTSAPVAEVAQPQSAELPVPEVKSIEVPAINKPITETPSVKSEERIPEPQALPSKSEESSTATADDKKREIQEPVVQQAKSVQPTEVATEVKSEQPAQNVEGVVPPKALETVSQASEQPAHVHVEQKPAESVKSLAPESTQQPAQESVTVPATETKQAAVPAIESTVIPAGISSERKIDAEAPAPIVSENVQTPVEPELKSLPAVPAVAALSVEPTANPSVESASSSSSSSSEKKASNESAQDSSSEDSSEESKESDDKKSA